MQTFNLCSQLQLDHSFKLIQLTPELLEVLESPEGDLRETGLSFKSLNDAKSEVVLCSKDKTWLLRQKNHSNTVMLMNRYDPPSGTIIEVPEDQLFGISEPPKDHLLGYSKSAFEYETKLIEGQLNLDQIPVYNEYDYELLEDDDDGMEDKTDFVHDLNELVEISPCSPVECLKQWYQVGGCSINGKLCILAKPFLSKLLNITLLSVMNAKLELDELTLSDTMNAVNVEMGPSHNFKIKMIETVLNKFGLQISSQASAEITWKLHIPTIVEWYGLEALTKYATKESVPVDEFLIKWKSLFPPFFPSNIDIKMLRGNFYRPIDNHIQFISKNILPSEPKSRFKALFKLQNTWELDDIAPFIAELNTRGIKLDSFIMKYARRRRAVGDNRKPVVLVTSRD